MKKVIGIIVCLVLLSFLISGCGPKIKDCVDSEGNYKCHELCEKCNYNTGECEAQRGDCPSDSNPCTYDICANGNCYVDVPWTPDLDPSDPAYSVEGCDKDGELGICIEGECVTQ